MARHKYLIISTLPLMSIFRGEMNARVVNNQLPKDAHMVSMGHNQFGLLYAVIESRTFPDLKEGQEMEELPPIEFETIRDGA